jgi:hypothetical protein
MITTLDTSKNSLKNNIESNPTQPISPPSPQTKDWSFFVYHKKGKNWIFGQFFHSVNSANFAIHFGRIHQVFNITKLGKKILIRHPTKTKTRLKKK